MSIKQFITPPDARHSLGVTKIRKMVQPRVPHSLNVPGPTETRWQRYKELYPETSFTRLVVDLLDQYFDDHQV